MTPEKLFHELLGLGLNWEVMESRFERESATIFLEIGETARLWTEVIDADLSGYFDNIPHRPLLRLVAKRVSGPLNPSSPAYST